MSKLNENITENNGFIQYSNTTILNHAFQLQKSNNTSHIPKGIVIARAIVESFFTNGDFILRQYWKQRVILKDNFLFYEEFSRLIQPCELSCFWEIRQLGAIC